MSASLEQRVADATPTPLKGATGELQPHEPHRGQPEQPPLRTPAMTLEEERIVTTTAERDRTRAPAAAADRNSDDVGATRTPASGPTAADALQPLVAVRSLPDAAAAPLLRIEATAAGAVDALRRQLGAAHLPSEAALAGAVDLRQLGAVLKATGRVLATGMAELLGALSDAGARVTSLPIVGAAAAAAREAAGPTLASAGAALQPRLDAAAAWARHVVAALQARLHHRRHGGVLERGGPEPQLIQPDEDATAAATGTASGGPGEGEAGTGTLPTTPAGCSGEPRQGSEAQPPAEFD